MNMASELRTRIVSGTLLALIVIALTLVNFWSFAALLIVAFVILMREWLGLIRTRSYRLAWVGFGILYIGAAIVNLTLIHFIAGPILVLVLLLSVAVMDSAAYFVGKPFGKHKIAPKISPGKSWEGLFGAWIGVTLVFAGLTFFFHLPVSLPILLLSALLFTLLGLGGDLFESWMKRRAGVKDSGRLIPGHGGLFDRVDALIPCAILAGYPLMMIFMPAF
ncbi:MAG: phosphatidate cytidylyltransferase [Alphaproteobacteria bacterium]|jgi:phosphatidate cytidylyltransferase